MKQGMVSILMPVLNGEIFLPQSLESLLAQEYRNFEIIILDNLSSDRTPVICRDYARRDARVQYVLDDTNRITHDAANHLATLINGEFAMYACDDDLWAPDFLSRLVRRLQADPRLGLVFPNSFYVDMEGRKGNRRLLRGRAIYRSDYSRFSNFWHYLGARRVVPTLFGIYRTAVLKQALPFDTFDETIADVDNLFMLKLLSMTTVECVDEPLFFYRNKYRWADPDLLPNYPKDGNAFKIWLYDLAHQKRFTRKVMELIGQADFDAIQKVLLRVRAYQSLAYQMTAARLRAWVGRMLVKLGLRGGGVTQSRDISAEIRHGALLHAEKTAEVPGRSSDG